MLLSLIPVLESEEIHLLSQTLPDECVFLKRKGLVHLLPSILKDMLCGTERSLLISRSTIELEKSYRRRGFAVSEAIDGDQKTFSRIFSAPHIEADSVGNRSLLRAMHTTMRNVSLSLTSRSDTLNNHDPDIENESINDYRSPQSHTMRANSLIPDYMSPSVSGDSPVFSIPEESDFEITLQNILDRKTKITLDWLKEKVQNSVVSNVYYVISGGGMSDRLMVALMAGGALGIAFGTALQRRFHHPDNNLISVVKSAGDDVNIKALANLCRSKGIEQLLKVFVKKSVTCAIPCLQSLTITAGSMLLVRKVQDSQILSKFSTLFSSRAMLPIARNFMRKIRVSGLKIFADSGRQYRFYDTYILLIVSAWTLTAFLAYKLHQNVKSLRWVFNSIIMKLLADYDCPSESMN